ncbi:MAG: cation transporter [Candidatus Eremiobacteraeota bacterium]|jgi:cation diffusion facilitator family transporter|nr:cation transporter [Candidatus Eremiobacteraeota bacterium]
MAQRESAVVVYAALAANALIAVTKFGAAAFTGSSAMFSEAIHSVVDTGNQLLLLYGMRRSSRPATNVHPFGHGLQLYVWSFLVAMIIFGLGACLSIVQGIEKIRQPHPIEHAFVNYLVLAAALVFESAGWIVAYRHLRADSGGKGVFKSAALSKDPAVFTVLFEDSAALAGLVIAGVGLALAQLLSLPVLDGVASVVIGLTLAVTALLLARECESLLTGESADPEVRADIERIARDEPIVDAINDVLTMHFGPNDVLVALSLDFVDTVSAADVEQTVTRIERAIKAAHPEVTKVFVEAQSFEAHLRGSAENAAQP